MEIQRKKDTAVFTFGRFQPPTKGHGVLIKEVERLAGEKDADGFVFVSSSIINPKYFTSKKFYNMIASGSFESFKNNENPLNSATKVAFLHKMYPGTEVTFVDTTVCGCTTLPKILEKLEGAGYKQVEMVVGSDRVNSFSKFLNIPILPAGEIRNLTGAANAGNLKTVSGTKMRMAAVAKKFDTFRNGVKQGTMTNDNVRNLMKKVREGLGYKEEDAEKQEGGRRRTHRRKKSSRFQRTLKRKN
jgi:hypothetical protein